MISPKVINQHLRKSNLSSLVLHNPTYCDGRRVVAGVDRHRATDSLTSIWRPRRQYYLSSEQLRHASLDAFSLDNNVRQSPRTYTVWLARDHNIRGLSRVHF